MNTVQYKGSQASGLGDTSRGPSQSIWADFPSLEIRSGAVDGIEIYDDFVLGPRVGAAAEANYGAYRGFASTGGAVNDGNEIGGVLVLSSDGDDEGASFRSSSCPFQISRSHQKFWFEARVKTSDATTNTKHGIFVGLMEDQPLTAVLPITASGALADINLLGFHRLEGDADYFDTVYKANLVTQATVQADAVQIADDTYVKLGMVFDPATRVVSFYRNGVRLSNSYTVTSVAGDPFPNDVRMGLVIAVLNATATTPGNAKIDWWRAGQLL